MSAGIGCGEGPVAEKFFESRARQAERRAALIGVGRFGLHHRTEGPLHLALHSDNTAIVLQVLVTMSMLSGHEFFPLARSGQSPCC